jgi:phosphomethylpyrimidine synthase
MGLIDELKKGNIPEYLGAIAINEGVEPEELAQKILDGSVVVPLNAMRSIEKPCGIGDGLRVKVNANLGTSADYLSLEEELKKLDAALRAGADTVMDLSTGGDLRKIRKKIIESSPVPVGTVPVYEAAVRAIDERGSIVEMKPEDMLEVIEMQAADGVDFMTIHAGVSLRTVEILERQPRVLGVVSRGGSFLVAWMLHNEKENPLLERFDDVLGIMKKYDVTLSLGDGLRPGCIADSTDEAQLDELLRLGELTQRAREAGVQVMVEGPGHVPLNEIEANIKLEKKICKGAPFYVLGPLPTDAAPGYDHLVSAVGGALAAYFGADFLCYVTPREHLGLPTVEDVYEGVLAAKIAAHIADVARGRKDALERDLNMARARANLDWDAQVRHSIVPEKTERMLKERSSGSGHCTMCGPYCAIEIIRDHFGFAPEESC